MWINQIFGVLWAMMASLMPGLDDGVHRDNPTEPSPAGPSVAKQYFPNDLHPGGGITLTPGFAPDGETIYFAQSSCAPIWECPQYLKRSHRTKTGWSTPELVPLPDRRRADYPSVTPDGHRLLFSWQKSHPGTNEEKPDENFDLWQIDLTEHEGNPLPLKGPDLNRVRAGAVRTLRFVNNETAPFLTRDGDLYFWTERLDGLGDRDVYRAASDGKGGYEVPIPLPAPINSAGSDDGMWISPDGRTMLITYADRGGCGGSDVFIAYKMQSRWSEPRNLGCAINSPYDELAASIIPHTDQIVFPSNRPVDGSSLNEFRLWTARLPGPAQRE
ncbi:MAG: hypothetical protein AAFR29_04720 [Pseudomonadota bacterium]